MVLNEESLKQIFWIVKTINHIEQVFSVKQDT